MGRNVYVVVHGDDWAVRLQDETQVQSVHRTQKEAEDAGRVIAKREKSELLTQGENGQWRSKDSFGNDPRNVHDTEH